MRCADRLLVQVGVFPARTFDDLFEGAKALPWPEWLPQDAEFPVTGRSVKSLLHSVPDCQAIVKKAIVESMKQSYGLERFPETGSLFPIHISLVDDIATVTLDTSGAGLHKRGYRQAVGIAPLKETLAAGMLYLTRWSPGRPLLDPFCGSGTIPVEAAMIGLNMAPGASRPFVAEKWPVVGDDVWRLAREEARDVVRDGTSLDISGSDIDSLAIPLAREHAHLAGVEKHLRFEVRAVKDVRLAAKYGCIICNPPYGERVGTTREAEQAYRDMRYALQALNTWSIFVLTANRQFEKLYGRSADKRRRLYNGPIECTFYQFFGPLPPLRDARQDAE